MAKLHRFYGMARTFPPIDCRVGLARGREFGTIRRSRAAKSHGRKDHDVLPAPGNFSLGIFGSSRAEKNALEPFVTARRLLGHPVTVGQRRSTGTRFGEDHA
jgi:hypothetical protein